jgi:hypothetical protein
MVSISINPTHPVAGRPMVVGVGGSACNPFNISILYLDTEPPSVVDDGSGANPPDADLTFVPASAGTYQVKISCNGHTTASRDFNVS